MKQEISREDKISNYSVKKLYEVCDVEFGTRVVQKKDGGNTYPVYGGGGATFKMDIFNREDCLVVARFALSKQCTRFIKGKFFLNDSGLTVKPKNFKVLAQEYLNYHLLFLNNNIYSLSRGTAQRNLNVSEFRNIEISYPKSISTQLHIANILSKAENLIAQRKESIVLLDEYLKSTFLEMFGDPVVNNKNWKKKKLKELADDFKYGTNLISGNKQIENSIPILRIPNIINDKVNYTDLKYSVLEESEKNKVLLRKGDLLFVRTNGNPNYIARCAVFKDDLICGYASYLIRVRLKHTSGTTPEFIKYIASLPSFRRTIVSKAKTTAGNYNINTDGLKALNFIIPTLELQNQFTQIVEKTEALKTQYQTSLQELENLYGSLSQRAFKGELNFYTQEEESVLMAAEVEVKYSGMRKKKVS